MLIDTTRCIGCFTCRVACQRQNSLGPEVGLVRFEEHERGTYPLVSLEHVPLQCMHCQDAPCVGVCPTGASFKGGGGIVGVDPGRCIGCKYCMAACPYRVRSFDEASGTVDKCRFCAVQTLSGAATCTCVDACPTSARIFGDLDDPTSELSRAIVERNALPIAGGLTQVSVFYVR
jgi:Fe-S-cluster-containing dehydrogenase component